MWVQLHPYTTLKRHIQTISQKRHDIGVHGLLVDKAFTIASADNIDSLQSHAAVYSGSSIAAGMQQACNLCSLSLSGNTFMLVGNVFPDAEVATHDYVKP